MTNADIRPARDSDLDTLVRIARQSFREAYEDTDDPQEIDDYVTRHFTREYFADVLAEPASRLVVVEQAHEPVGYVHTRFGDAPEGVDTGPALELRRFYLLENAKGKGLGSLMMTWVLGESERVAADTIWLQVYELNARAIAFYRRYGFEQVGTKAFEFGGRIYHDPMMVRRL